MGQGKSKRKVSPILDMNPSQDFVLCSRRLSIVVSNISLRTEPSLGYDDVSIRMDL
jgi:hypothetical protein